MTNINDLKFGFYDSFEFYYLTFGFEQGGLNA
jgi:hypothetical protein